MRRARLAGVAAGAVAVMVLTTATPAWAHEEITPQTFRTGQPTFFRFSAANEHKAPLIKVTLAAPAGLPFGAGTNEPPGWTVDRAGGQIVWSGGSVAPDHFGQWGFEVEGADQPGNFAYSVTLTFGDGTSDDAEVDTTATLVTETQRSVVGAAVAQSATPTVAIVALVVALLSAFLSAAALLLRRRPHAGVAPDASGQDW